MIQSRADQRTDQSMDQRTDLGTDPRTDLRTDPRTDLRTDLRTDPRTDLIVGARHAARATKAVGITGLVLCALLASNLALPGAAQSQADRHNTLAQNVRLSGTIRIMRASPPQSGVRLIEEVFQRVRSAPQVAMAKSLKVQEEQKSQSLQKDGPTDYALAIRPKQTGKIAMLPSPTLQLVPPRTGASNRRADTFVANGGAPVNFGLSLGGAAGDVGVAGGLSTGGATIAASNEAAPPPPASPVAETWYGNKQFPLIASAPQRAPGLWENSVSSSADERASQTAAQKPSSPAFAGGGGGSAPNGVYATSAPSATPRGGGVNQPVVPLGTAVGRLMKTANAVQQAQMGKLVHQPTDMLAARDKKAEETRYRSVNINNFVADDLEDVGSQLPPLANGGALMKKKADSAAAPAKSAHYHLSMAAKEKDAAGYADEHPASLREESNRNSSINGRRLAFNNGDLALLPPNVVTGIPLVRLGAPETQASAALSSMGAMHHEKVNKWSVWTWQRNVNSTQALQLYMRNGLLDAMRIFDPSLIASDFGVSLGDDLSKVKEKFGEPAFILQEPRPGVGQNYIYPISQVGFQLARPAADQSPRVVSVLIFNVK
jgi:hypothetical protein